MKIQRFTAESVLNFPTFTVDFGKAKAGLHVLYGPNEAGKSTFLKLLLDSMFGGSPGAESKDYYTNKKSRLEVVLERPDGTPILAQRIVTRNKLVLTNDTTTDITEEDVLACLGGYDRERFMLLFGFDHQRLREGGQSLLSSGGDVGVSLFEAGGGIQYLQGLLEKLGVMSDEFFDPKFGARSNRLLNKAWRNYQQMETSVRSGSLRGEDWKRQRDAIDRLQHQVENSKGQLQTLRAEEAKLQRISRVRSLLIDLQGIRQALLDLGEITLFPEDVQKRVPDLLAIRREALVAIDQYFARRQRQQELLETIRTDEPALVEAKMIESLTEGMGRYNANKSELIPELQVKRTARKSDLEELLAAYAPAVSLQEVRKLLIPAVEKSRIEHLSEVWRSTVADIELKQANHDELIESLAQLGDQINAIGDILDVSGLQSQLRLVRERGDLEERIESVAAALLLKRQQLEQIVKSQNLWYGEPEQASVLPFPLGETIDGYKRSWLEWEDKIRIIRKELEDSHKDLEKILYDLAELELFGTVPVAADLATARQYRQTGWKLVKKVWQEGLPEGSSEVLDYTGEQSLAMAFESAMTRADATVDRMLEESERSTKRGLLMLQRKQVEEHIGQLTATLDEYTTKFAELQADWECEWRPSGIVPKSPAEMKDWINSVYRPLLQGVVELQTSTAEQERLLQERNRHVNALQGTLSSLGCAVPKGDELKALLDVCDVFLAEVQAKKSKKNELVIRQEEAKRRSEQTERALLEQRDHLQSIVKEWAQLRERYPHLPENPEVGGAYLRGLDNLLAAAKEVADMTAQLESLQTACQEFEQQAAELAKRLKEEPSDATLLSAWLRQIRARLDAARDAETRKRQIQEEIVRIDTDLQVVQARLTSCEKELLGLQEQYHCADAVELGHMVELSMQRKEFDANLRQSEQNVVRVGDGLSVEQLEKEVAEFEDPDEVPGRLTQLNIEIRERERELEEIAKKSQEQQVVFRQLDGSNEDAAESAQQAEAHLAEVDRYWQEYLRVELARRLLQQTVDDFREQNESPVLERASTLFRHLTLQRYSELAVEYEGQTPYLEALHMDGSKRRVQQLSEGTRDQLFLALRLAFVERQLAISQPLPLIMDDILINFDDFRAKATLEILHELSGRTQVLYLTHQQSIVDLADNLTDRRRVTIHRL